MGSGTPTQEVLRWISEHRRYRVLVEGHQHQLFSENTEPVLRLVAGNDSITLTQTFAAQLGIYAPRHLFDDQPQDSTGGLF